MSVGLKQNLFSFAALPVSFDGLTVLSFGAGQDSTAMLYKYAYEPDWRARFVPPDEDFLVVCVDTGDEHRQTYAHIAEVKDFCAAHQIAFIHLTPDMGFHSQAWLSLIAAYRRNDTVGSKAYVKSCTDNLKIQPFYRYLSHYLKNDYGFSGFKKEAFYQFLRLFGRKIKVLIGLAAGEERRIADHTKFPRWMQDTIQFLYPLIEDGMNREACQHYIRRVGHMVPMPSNCKRCPYVSEVELVWLYRFERADFDEWVELENNKLRKFAHKGAKNYGVFGKQALPDVLAGALAKYGEWSDAQLWDHKMNHGHCVMSKY
jgi:hypothetical protein